MKRLLKHWMIVVGSTALTLPVVLAKDLNKRAAGEVVTHHIEAFKKGDLPALLADYADDAVMVMPDGVFAGRQAIGQALQNYLGPNKPPGTMVVSLGDVTGEIAMENWTLELPGGKKLSGADVFVVRDGRVVFQTFKPTVPTG